MIRISSQALALNAAKIPWPDYRMDQTVKLEKNACPLDVVGHIQNALKNIGEPKLNNLVINSHGYPGIIVLHVRKYRVDGEKEKDLVYIGIEHLGLFKQFKGKIGTVWLTGCQTAGTSIGRSGQFCAQLAMTIGGNVIAADVKQYVNPGYYLRLFPPNCIDEFEGTAYQWDASGKKTVFSRREWYQI